MARHDTKRSESGDRGPEEIPTSKQETFFHKRLHLYHKGWKEATGNCPPKFPTRSLTRGDRVRSPISPHPPWRAPSPHQWGERRGEGLKSVPRPALVQGCGSGVLRPLAILSCDCAVSNCPTTALLYCIENPFAVWIGVVKCRSCAWAVLNRARQKHVRTNLSPQPCMATVSQIQIEGQAEGNWPALGCRRTF
jgi:hypothetical protein